MTKNGFSADVKQAMEQSRTYKEWIKDLRDELDDREEKLAATTRQLRAADARWLRVANGEYALPPHVVEVLQEVSRAETLWPDWPSDILHALSIVTEELGEVIQIANDIVIHGEDTPANWADMRKEAIQAAAMTLRFLGNLPDVPRDAEWPGEEAGND